jgi:hypothetical protein
MNNLIVGDLPMVGMASMGPNLLPMWVTWVWLVALAAVLVLHCGHFVRMGGQHRWFHASHILMLVSQIYMFAGMEYKWKWFPGTWWVAIFWVSTLVIAGWLILRLVQRRPFSFLWVFALIMQAAMIYMWMPNWAPALTWTLVFYFGIETMAWLGGLLDDSKPTSVGVGGGRVAVPPVASGSAAAAPRRANRPANVGLLDDTKRSTGVVADVQARFVPLGHDSAAGRVSMAVMAASMAYMFAAMQLMR